MYQPSDVPEGSSDLTTFRDVDKKKRSEGSRPPEIRLHAIILNLNILNNSAYLTVEMPDSTKPV